MNVICLILLSVYTETKIETLYVYVYKPTLVHYTQVSEYDIIGP